MSIPVKVSSFEQCCCLFENAVDDQSMACKCSPHLQEHSTRDVEEEDCAGVSGRWRKFSFLFLIFVWFC